MRLIGPQKTLLKDIFSNAHYNTTVKNKDKEGILKAAREERHVTLQSNLHKAVSDFSEKNLQTRRKWNDIFNV